ncbi:MAG: type VI secretion system protein TssA [Pseudomonadota bacterium]
MVELDTILAPIEGDSPVGVDLRADAAIDSAYIQIKDARAEARDVERQIGVSDPSEVMAEAMGAWRKILDLAPKTLSTVSKDLEIASWYVEALTRFDGFDGLNKGVELLVGLVEAYWDQGLFPVEDEDGIETRVAPLAALNGVEGPGTLIRPIKMIPFTATGDPEPFAYWQYEQAVATARITDPERLEARLAEGGVTMDSIQRAAGQSPADFLQSTYQAVSAAMENYKRLSSMMMEKAGDEAPPSSNIVGVLDEVQRAMRAVAPQVVATTEAEQDLVVDGEVSEQPAAGGAALAVPAGAIKDREDAFRRLSEIAEYFERSEPTSIVPATIRELVHRARMPLPDLLQELLHDDPNARDTFLLRAGIKPRYDEA